MGKLKWSLSRFHLSTCLVTMLVSSIMVCANLNAWYQKPRDIENELNLFRWYEFGFCAVSSFSLIVITAMVCEWLTVRRATTQEPSALIRVSKTELSALGGTARRRTGRPRGEGGEDF